MTRTGRTGWPSACSTTAPTRTWPRACATWRRSWGWGPWPASRAATRPMPWRARWRRRSPPSPTRGGRSGPRRGTSWRSAIAAGSRSAGRWPDSRPLGVEAAAELLDLLRGETRDAAEVLDRGVAAEAVAVGDHAVRLGDGHPDRAQLLVVALVEVGPRVR